MKSALLESAAGILAMVSLGMGSLRAGADQRAVDLQLAVIASAARGRLHLADLDAVPDVAWTDPARALAALCARHALRTLGPARVSFFAARMALVMVPRFIEREAFGELVRSAETELDYAEATEPSAGAVDALLADIRARACLAELRPVLEALDRGEPLRGTGELLRQAADAFEGPRRRRAAA